MTFGSLVALALTAVRNPREAATTLLSVGIPSGALPPALLLVVVLSVLLSVLGEALGLEPAEGFSLPPLVWTLFLCAGLFAYIVALFQAGRAMGGTGSLAETTLLTIFWQFILLLAQIVQLFLWIAAPPLAGLFFFAVLVMAFWIEVNFIDVLHGYGSLLKSVALLFLVLFGLAILFVLILPLSGATVSGTA